MSFHQQGWDTRFQSMGDQAEGLFEAVWPRGWARYGLNRPPIQMHRLSLKLRYTPDYITSYGLIEVQGFGRDRKLKIKHEKFSALHRWESEGDKVMFFFYDSVLDQWCTVDLDVMVAACAEHGEVGVYPEGKTYVSIHADNIPTFNGWHPVEREDD